MDVTTLSASGVRSFRYVRPADVNEALAELGEDGAWPLAGGTDLVVLRKPVAVGRQPTLGRWQPPIRMSASYCLLSTAYCLLIMAGGAFVS